MLDTSAIQKMVEDQIKSTVDEQVLQVLTSDDWLQPLEQKILVYTQERILKKFANSSAVPEIVESVKNSIGELFAQGKIPGIDQYVDQDDIKRSVNAAVDQLVQHAAAQIGTDPVWLEKIERMINQTIVQRTVATLGSIDLNPIIKQRIDENMEVFRQSMLKKFSSTGIDDQATSCQLTVMDDITVIENCLTAKELNIVESATIQDLIVKGTINTDNISWNNLSDAISKKTLDQINNTWTQDLVLEVADRIKEKGIDFNTVSINGELLVSDGRLSDKITQSNLQSIGRLNRLEVDGEAHINQTVSIINKRLGINTNEPEMALSVWDEEVSLTLGRFKNKQAWIGTNRDQGLSIGVNRLPQIEINSDGMTTIKKLRIGVHQIMHDSQVPGWAGTRGDFVFNSNPGTDRVFAWVCLGAHKWQTLKSAE